MVCKNVKIATEYDFLFFFYCSILHGNLGALHSLACSLIYYVFKSDLNSNGC